MSPLDGQLVRVTVKLLKHKDKNIDAICDHYHDTDFKDHIQIPANSVGMLWYCNLCTLTGS